jgi:hypothetical protein
MQATVPAEEPAPDSIRGHCSCNAVRYRIAVAPIIVHACHCSWCQRETGTAFAWNALVERDRLTIVQGDDALEEIATPSASGKGQRVLRCKHCRVALWSHYPGGGNAIAFVRVGTLEHPASFPPDAHIFTSTKQPWLQLPADAAAYAEFYDPKIVWSEEQRARYKAAKVRAGEA